MSFAHRVLRDVKHSATRIVTPGKVRPPHEAYMAITILEMEKVRREIERNSLLVRLNGITTRLREMEAEKAALLRDVRRHAHSKAGRPFEPLSRMSPSRPAPGGFKFQY